MEINTIFIKDEELDKKIFRIVPFDRFMDCLVNETNVFVRPSMWDDPFENLLSNPSKNVKISYKSEKYYVYAQCWSFLKENDLLWRNYSPNGDGVRIQSTPRKILHSILQSGKIQKIENEPDLIFSQPQSELLVYEEIEVFLGKVKYLSYEKISKLFKKILTNGYYKPYLTSLLIKREAFKNEEEFRIGLRYVFDIFDTVLVLSDNLLNYDIKVNEVFEEVVFDPRISSYKFEGLKHQIEKKGFLNPIIKSKLYDRPNIDELII